MALTLALMSCKSETKQDEEQQQQVVVSTQMHKSAKRGVSYSFGIIEDMQLLSPIISWTYNWGPDISGTNAQTITAWMEMDEVEFCPMAWNGNYNKSRIATWTNAHRSTTRYLLAFNEPNLTDQARMTPSEAAALWPELKSFAESYGLKIVSPAMNYGTLSGYSDPIKWLDEFFAQPGVSLDDVSAIAIHCYMGSPSAVKGYIQRFEKYGKPIWMTEFCGWDDVISSAEVQKNYMCDVINYMEMSPLVERYAWFIPRAGEATTAYPYKQLLTKTSPYQLTELGEIFGALSSFDKTVWFDASKLVPANLYAGLANSTIYIRPTTDTEGQWMLTAFKEGQRVDWQVAATQPMQTVQLRYATPITSEGVLYIDGEPLAKLNFTRTGSNNDWQMLTYDVTLNAGYHTVSIEMISGSICFNGFNWK